MKKMLIASTALALMAAPSFAENSGYELSGQQPAAADRHDNGWSGDGHALEGTPVYTNDGEQVGSVERVRGGGAADSYRDLTDGTTRDLDVTGLVVETGGFLGIGTREVELQAGSAQRTSVDGEQRILLDMSNAEFQRLREYAEDDEGDDWRNSGRDMNRDANQNWDSDTATTARTDARSSPTSTASMGDSYADDDAFRGDHPLRDVAVYTSDGERVGSVERLRGGARTGTYTDLSDGTTRDLDVTGLVVETGGFLGIGTREVEIEAGSAQRTSVDGEQRILLDMSNAEFERLREYAGDDDDWRDSDRDMNRDTNQRWDRTTDTAGRTDTGRDGQSEDRFRDDHPLRDVAVYTNDGERVGSVERVRGGGQMSAYRDLTDGTTRDLDVNGLVVETGGFLGIGTREVEIEAGSAQRTSVDGEQRIVLDMSNAEFERLREHARDDDSGMWNDTSNRSEQSWQNRQDDTATQTGASNQARTDARTQTQADAGMTGQTQTGQTAQRAHASGEVHAGVYTEEHDWVDAPVFSSDGERLGRVHQVRSASGAAYGGGNTGAMTGGQANVEAIIVRTGGFLGIGSRDVEVQGDRMQLEMQDDEPRLVVDMTKDRFDDMPVYDRDRSNRAGG